MKKMNIIPSNMKKTMGLFFVILFSTLSVVAQWAGEDKNILRLSNNQQQVTIGVQDPNPQACYQWSGPNILTDPSQSTVMVNPIDSLTTYYVTRVSIFGVEEDEVKVSISDSVCIVSVTPLKKCYNHNDAITEEDFVFVTNPVGYESMVQVFPRIASNSFSQLSEQPLTFTLSIGGHTSTKTLTTKVVNKDVSIGSEGGLPDIAIVEKINNLFKKAFKEKGSDIKELLDKSPISPPCNFNIPSVSVNIGSTTTKECCNDVYDKSKLNLSGSVSMGYSCAFPIPQLTIPYVTEVGVTMGISLGLGLNLELNLSECEQSEICLGADVSVGMTAGFYGQIVSKDVCRLELTVNPVITIGGCQICYPTGFKWGLLCLEITGSANATLLSLKVFESKIVLVEKKCLGGQL